LLTILTLAEIVEKIGSSAAESFAVFYEQSLPKVYRYINYRIPDVQTAEDLTSAVFEKALNKFKSYDSRKAKFSTWVFTIARNILIDHFRSSQRVRTVDLEAAAENPSPLISPEEEADRAEDVRLLNVCLAELSDPEKEIISLKFGAEMTNRQIAGVLALSESNVGVILFRAVRKLRDEFRGRQNGQGIRSRKNLYRATG
jgi:RNA polymerase sigma-70 factor, ECF subfamily